MAAMQRRFKQSGNPKGRPRDAKNRNTIVRTVANEMYTVSGADGQRRLSTVELVLLRLRNMALEALKVSAFEDLHRVMKAYQPQETNDDFLADLAVALCAERVKLGSPVRSERNAKFNRLFAIEDELGLRPFFFSNRYLQPRLRLRFRSWDLDSCSAARRLGRVGSIRTIPSRNGCRGPTHAADLRPAAETNEPRPAQNPLLSRGIRRKQYPQIDSFSDLLFT